MAKQKTDLEGMFWLQVRAKGLDKGCVAQFKAVEGRRFAWDFAWPDHPNKPLVEIQGSIWVKGGHNTGAGLNRDYLKNNLATIKGMDILYFSGDMIKDGTAISQLEEYFASRTEGNDSKRTG